MCLYMRCICVLKTINKYAYTYIYIHVCMRYFKYDSMCVCVCVYESVLGGRETDCVCVCVCVTMHDITFASQQHTSLQTHRMQGSTARSKGYQTILQHTHTSP